MVHEERDEGLIYYEESIAKRLAKMDRNDVQVEDVEEMLRIRYNSFDGLTSEDWDYEVEIAVKAIDHLDSLGWVGV